MRPRHKTAENAVAQGTWCPDWFASMRPRHKTAENPLGSRLIVGGGACFNEAAA